MPHWNKISIHGKPAIDWIQMEAYLRHPVEFHDAVKVLGPKLADYFYQELSLRDHLLRPWWLGVQQHLPAGFVGDTRTIEQRQLDALYLLNVLENPPPSLRKPILALINESIKHPKPNPAILRTSMQIIRRTIDELDPDSLSLIQKVYSRSKDPSVMLAALCLMEKSHAAPPDSIPHLLPVVDQIYLESSDEIRWLLQEATSDYTDLGKHLLVKNRILRGVTISAFFHQRNFAPHRKEVLLSLC